MEALAKSSSGEGGWSSRILPPFLSFKPPDALQLNTSIILLFTKQMFIARVRTSVGEQGDVRPGVRTGKHVRVLTPDILKTFRFWINLPCLWGQVCIRQNASVGWIQLTGCHFVSIHMLGHKNSDVGTE